MKFFIFRFIYNKIKHTNLMTQNMRSPGKGFLGIIAKTLMLSFNKAVINDAVNRLNIKRNEKIIEIGSGNGEAIEKMLQLTKKEIMGIEISDVFREGLIKKFKGFNVSFYSNDAKNLKKIIPNNTIDKLLAVNVIYFLDPLEDYAREFYRILNLNGFGILACKFEGIKKFNTLTAPNKDLKGVTKIFEKVGFNVSSELVNLGNDQSKYYAIRIRKVSNE